MTNNKFDFVTSGVRTIGLTLAMSLGLGVAASPARAEAQGVISFSSGLTFKGAFVHEPDTDTPAPWVYGRVVHDQDRRGNSKELLLLKGLLKDGSSMAISILGPIEQVSKVPHTYKFDAGGSELIGRYLSNGTDCFITYGTLTLKAAGAVDGPIVGTLSGLQWSRVQCEKLGKSGSFKMQRAVDGK